MTVWIVFGVIALILVVAYIAGKRHRGKLQAHSSAVREVAGRNGWAYTEQSETAALLCQSIPAAYGKPHHMFQDAVFGSKETTRSPVKLEARNVMEAQVDGRDVLIFDLFAWHVAHPQDKRGLVYRHTVWAVELPNIPCWVQAATKNQWHDKWMGTWFSTDDAAFDDKFRATSGDAVHLHRYLTPESRRLLLDSGFDGWRLDPRNQHLLVWTYKRHPEPEQIVDLARKALELAAAASRTLAT